MRRIALVCDWYSPRRGGIEAHLDGLATRLMKQGDEVHVITSTPGEPVVNGVRVHRLDVRLLPWAGVAVTPAAWPIQQILVRERIDVVHSHVSIVAPVGLGGALAAARAKLPSVITFHSIVPGTPVLAGAAGFLLQAWQWPAVFTAVSRRVANEVSAFVPRARIELLPNAIDTEFWQPEASEAARRGVRMVFAGRLQAKKRPRVLLRVLDELQRLSSTHSFALRIVGSGPLQRGLERVIRASGWSDRVEFTGWLDASRLREMYRSSDIFLSTATRESFGLAALEARSVGLAVVAMRRSAVAEFITHEVSGLLADDDAAFAHAVARLVKDAPLRERIIANNRSTPVPFSWDNSISLHDAAYDKATALAKSGYHG